MDSVAEDLPIEDEAQGDDILDKFTSSIRDLENRVTQLETENQELRTALNAVLDPFGSLSTAQSAMSDIATQVETVPEDLHKIQEVLNHHQKEIQELKSFSNSDTADDKIESRYIRSTWDPSTKTERRAKLVYVELLKKKKEAFPDGRILKSLSNGEILSMLNEAKLSPAYRDLAISSYAEAKTIREEIQTLSELDIFLADVYTDELRRTDAAGNKRLLKCLVVEVMS